MPLIAERAADGRGRRPWLGRFWNVALAALPAAIVGTFLANGTVSAVLFAETALVLIVTSIAPSLGLILVAAIVPLGETLWPVLGAHAVRHAELMVLAFLAAWLVVRAASDEGPSIARGSLGMSSWVFSWLVVTSTAATAMQLYTIQPEALRTILGQLTRSYLVTGDSIGAHSAGNLLEGIGLLVAVAELSRRERWLTVWLPTVLVASGVAVSVASGLLALGIGAPGTLARHAAVGLPRYSAAQADVNAAASYGLLVLGVCVGLAVGLRRTRPVWLLASAALVAGLVLAGSRSAFVAGGLVLAVGPAVRALRSVSPKVLAFGVVAAAASGAILLIRPPAGLASLGMRYGFTQASLHMIAARPVFGVGEGRYYALSSLALPPSLGWWYGRENAHDYFLQTAAELGPIGLLAFVWIVVSAFTAAGLSTRSPASRPLALGWLAGSVAYLATCVTGHAILVPETAVPFWMVLGLLGGGDRAAPTGAMTRRAWAPAVAFACALVATVPFRRDVPDIRLPAGIDGFGPWRTDEGGVPFHEMRDFASVFVAQGVTSLEIPLRVGTRTREPVPVLVAPPAAPAVQILVRNEWTTASVNVPEGDAMLASQRVNLAVDPFRTAGSPYPSVYVGQPRIVSTR